MEYCRLHKDLTEEEGDGCPLCESMREKASVVDRWADDRKKLQGQLAQAKARLEESEYNCAFFKKRLEIAEGLLFKITHNELCHCAWDGENCYIEQAKNYLAAMEEVKEVDGGL